MQRRIILAMLGAPVGGDPRHKCYRRVVNLGLIPDLRQRQPRRTRAPPPSSREPLRAVSPE